MQLTKVVSILKEIGRQLQDKADNHFFTSEINKCLDNTAPWKTRKMNHKKYSLPRELQAHIQKRKELQKRYQINVKNGEKDLDLLKELKKHSNFTNL